MYANISYRLLLMARDPVGLFLADDAQLGMALEAVPVVDMDTDIVEDEDKDKDDRSGDPAEDRP